MVKDSGEFISFAPPQNESRSPGEETAGETLIGEDENCSDLKCLRVQIWKITLFNNFNSRIPIQIV